MLESNAKFKEVFFKDVRRILRMLSLYRRKRVKVTDLEKKLVCAGLSLAACSFFFLFADNKMAAIVCASLGMLCAMLTPFLYSAYNGYQHIKRLGGFNRLHNEETLRNLREDTYVMTRLASYHADMLQHVADNLETGYREPSIVKVFFGGETSVSKFFIAVGSLLQVAYTFNDKVSFEKWGFIVEPMNVVFASIAVMIIISFLRGVLSIQLQKRSEVFIALMRKVIASKEKTSSDAAS